MPPARDSARRVARASRSRAVRRRRLVLLAGAALALIAGAALGARHDDEQRFTAFIHPQPAPRSRPVPSPTPAAVDRLSLAQQVGKLIVLRFDGTEAPPYVRRALNRGWAAGAILFRDNVAAPSQLRQLTGALRASGRHAGATPIVCVDQEGGPIRIVSWAPPVSAAAGQRPGPDARAAGSALRALGINVALAPVGDVPSVAGAALETRAFSHDPRRAASAVAAAVKGWLGAGVAPTAKHFPGLGGTTVNTDRGSTVIAGGAPTGRDLAPFKAAISAGVPLVMSAHAVYPALDRAHIASQSPAVLEDLLRAKLGFKGVVMTDSIEAVAVRATGTTEQVAVRSIAAGNDIVLTTGQGSWIRAYRALLARARASKSFRARVRASAARVLALQARLR
ncbi:glycoside hydrolase family 3 N-terminal domain-containing protein [Candidatus Solirubrobacter pratensis]|uniref:glycoside hydrolase family 3 N-terminal domain-containing protein n=1 Tax=Candidatus Solirubrobacter pratensis TaxID=1298857 RepID=UPI0004089312|nr:glycoside hydrolase family 3 N-terminal domain-containing protein [Candidatus Solirubrobacter pratensis]